MPVWEDDLDHLPTASRIHWRAQNSDDPAAAEDAIVVKKQEMITLQTRQIGRQENELAAALHVKFWPIGLDRQAVR